MTTTSTAAPISNTYKASNPFAPFLSSSTSNHDVNLFAPNDISRDLEEEEEEEEARSEGEGYDTQLAQSRPTRPPFMSERHRSSSEPNVSPSSSRSHSYFKHKLHRKPAPPPPRPIFPPPTQQDVPVYAPPSNVRPERERERGRDEEKGKSREELERQERVLLQRAIEESKRDSVGSQRRNDEDVQLQQALEASRLEEQKRPRTPPLSSQEAQELEQALALSTNEPQHSYLSRSTNSPSPVKHSRSRSVSNSDGLPPFPFTQEDLVRPSYPKEKSHLFPQGLPSLPPGAGSTNDEYEKEMEMLTLAIRMSEEEERLRQEREERELREVVRKVEEKENALMCTSSNGKPPIPRRPSPTQSAETTSPTTSPKQKRSSWFRPPLASKYSTATSPPASPPLSPESTHRPGLEATPTDSTIRSAATSFRSAAESLPFSNLVPTTQSQTSPQQPHPPQPRRQPPPPPQPNRLPPSPPETPVVSNTQFSSPSTAPPIPPLPASYSRSRQGTADSDLSDLGQPTAPFVSAHSEAFRQANDGSPIEMPYLTPSASNSIRSVYRSADGRVASWALDERNGSNNSGSGSGSASASGHSRGNSVNRRSTDGHGDGVGRTTPDRSDEGGGDERRRSYEEGDEGDLNSMRLAIRNPDSSPAPPIEFGHQGRFVSEPPSVDVPRDVEGSELYGSEPGEGIIFESAYAGRSMSAIDEATEPASSIIAEEGGNDYYRQGSYPSTLGTMDSTVHQAVPEGDEDEGGEDMERSITYHARPMEEREWMHDSVLRRPSQPPPTASLTPTPPESDSPTSSSDRVQPQLPPPVDRGTIHARQMTASTESSAGNRLSFPLPPFNSTLPPTAPSPIDSVATTSLPIEQIGSSGIVSQATSTRQQQNAFADGTRFGHPSICARDPGHACPDDGLDGAEREVPESIELTALMDDPIGLGFNGDSARRREETGGKSILRDAWAVEARNWGSLLRFLMWYGDTKLVASPQDIALEPTRHCTAAASLEFRPDDEGYTIIRLVVAILPPDDPESHAHRELTVEHPSSTPPGKGKGKARSYFQSSSTVPSDNSTLATFHLPDSVHLPCRLSGLAIQLYTLRHLASIARSTMPAKEGAAPGYHALRELATALERLTAVAAGRQQRDTASSQALPNYGNQSGGGGGRADENERLLTRLRDRLRRLKRGSTANENNTTSPTKPNKLVKAPPRERGQPSGGGGGDSPTMARAAQPLARSERVLSANDHDQEEERLEEGSGNHVEVAGSRFSLVQREPQTMTRRERVPEEWQRRNSNNNQHGVRNETSYMPTLSKRP